MMDKYQEPLKSRYEEDYLNAAPYRHQEQRSLDDLSPPPPYDYEPPSRSSEIAPPVDSSITPPTTLSPRASLQPCVIPQITKSWQGAFASPFARAYPPAFEARGISKDAFITFIDGLNEAWLPNPFLTGTKHVGNVLGMVHGVHGELAIAGAAIAVASDVSSAAVSYIRAKRYFKTANGAIFHPVGLSAKILTTKKLCVELDYPEEKLKLIAREKREASRSPSRPPLDSASSPSFQTQGTLDPRFANASYSQDNHTSEMMNDLHLSPVPTQSQQGLHPSSSRQNLRTSSSQRDLLQTSDARYNLRANPSRERLQRYSSSSSSSSSSSLDLSLAKDEYVHTRFVEAFQDRVLPLDYNVAEPDPTAQANVLKRFGEYSARRATRKNEKKEAKRYRKGEKEQRKGERKAEKEQAKMVRELEKLERELLKKQNEAERKIAEGKDRSKVERSYEKEREKMQREADKVVREADKKTAKELRQGSKKNDKLEKKEQKAANKIRWIVISEWKGEEEDDDEDESDIEEDGLMKEEKVKA